MLGSTNPFGQSPNNLFGSPSLFGQTSSATSDPFGTQVGAQTGSSLFGGTSTGVFGRPSMSAFKASSTLAFGSSHSGQGPAFGGFGSSPSSFNGAFQQTQPTFGSSLFGSTAPAFGSNSTPLFGSTGSAFGASSTPAFGASNTSPFGTSSTRAFGASNTSPFGTSSTPAFGMSNTSPFVASSTPAFGTSNTSPFGASSTPAFGVSNTSPFGASSTPAFGVSNTSPFGASNTPAFGASSTPAFGVSNTSPFGASSTPAFGMSNMSAFGGSSTPAFGASSTPAFSVSNTSPFGGSSTPAFGMSNTSPFGASSTPTFASSTPAFGIGSTPAFGSAPKPFGTAQQSTRGGSRVAVYSRTAAVEATGPAYSGTKLESISGMPVYNDKSHEELRWDDYQNGDKGGNNPPAAQSSPLGASGPFAQTQAAPNPFSFGATSAQSNPFTPKTPAFGSTGFRSMFGSLAQSNPNQSGSTFGSTSSSPSIFGGSQTAPAFGSTSPSIFGSSTTASSIPLFGNSTQSSGLFQSSSPSFGFSTTPSTGFQQSGSGFGSNLIGSAPSTGLQQSRSGFSSGLFNSSPSTGFQQSGSGFGANMFSSNPSTGFQQSSSGFGSDLLVSTPSTGSGQTTNTLFQTMGQGQTSSTFSFGNFGQTPEGGAGGASSIFGQSGTSQSAPITQTAPLANPFGTLPVVRQMSIGSVGSTIPSVQYGYGISSLPVGEKADVPRMVHLMTVPKHLSRRRIRLPPRRYLSKSDAPKVAFFAEEEEVAGTKANAEALIVARDNPRDVINLPSSKLSDDSKQDQDDAPAPPHTPNEGEKPSAPPVTEEDDDYSYFDDEKYEDAPQSPPGQTGGSHDKYSAQKGLQAAIVYEHGAEIEALMPKLRRADYYMVPRVQDLAARERAQPGSCCRVPDFVVGRHGFGSIKFSGETDVRKLDLESIIQFNHKEVIVYKDEVRKPPVGQGLNKPAEVTLLNVKCFNRKTGELCTEGPRADRFREMLIKKTGEQGARFVSYDAAKGEWRFQVRHFSCYGIFDDFAI